jgi:hypothetical protein
MEDASVYDSRHDDAMPIACNSVLFFGLTIFVSWVTNNNLSFFFSYQSDGRGQMVQCEEWIWLHQSVKKKFIILVEKFYVFMILHLRYLWKFRTYETKFINSLCFFFSNDTKEDIFVHQVFIF